MMRWLQRQTMDTAVGCLICCAFLEFTGLAMRAVHIAGVLS